MNDLQVFGFEGRNVRVVEVKGEPWWVLRDVCDILEISNSRNVSDRLDDDEKGVRQMDTPGGMQAMTIINESGLFSAILRSEKPEARAFKKWITSEVIPSIRKTGSYGVPKDFTLPTAPKMREIRMFLKMGIIEREEARKALFQPVKEKGITKRDTPLQTPILPASTIRPLFAFFDHAEFTGWRMAIESNPHHFERLGVALRTRHGNTELLIQHDHKMLVKICGKDYKIALRDDPAYIGTVQAHIARNQVSCLVFDWDRI